ncbi:peptidase YpeB-like protein [Inmirania thermothiophila]|uniref:Peptidase YpeB-like protein n=2 Tax=Inmirania thermothiophila TaxID=1750597 RepID=A0A3N1Y7A9_9GAMM|nr:peptidase YpeB-like protein [Inmirania thermothiophila]
MLALAALAAAAGGGGDHERARRLRESGRVLSLERIMARIPPHLAGRILELELEDEDGRPVYEVEVLGKDGRVRKLLLDAASGRLLSVEDEEP